MTYLTTALEPTQAMNTIPDFPTIYALAAIALASALTACSDNDASATDVIEWNRFASVFVVIDQLPLVQTHVMAIVQLAVHYPLTTIEPRYARYQYAGAAPKASPAAAVAADTHGTLAQRLPQAASTIDEAYTAKLASITAAPTRDAFDSSQVASAIFGARLPGATWQHLVGSVMTHPGTSARVDLEWHLAGRTVVEELLRGVRLGGDGEARRVTWVDTFDVVELQR